MDIVTAESQGFSAVRLRRIDSHMQRYVDEGKLSGIIAAITRRGQLVYRETFLSGHPQGSVGRYGWGGAAGTRFWVDPQEELIGLFMIQFMPGNHYPIQDEFEVLTYQALVDGREDARTEDL